MTGTKDILEMREPDWGFEPEFEEEQDPDICPYCGLTMLDDMEVGQGYCMTPPCWMWATGQIELAQQWEADHECDE